VIPIRTAAVVDATEAAVRRALRRVDLWARTARALGGRGRLVSRADGAPLTGAELRAGDRLELVGVAGRRGLRCVVALDDDGLPQISGPGFAVTTRATGTAAGTLVTVDCRIVVRVPGGTVLGRRRALAFGRMLIGITTLLAREPLVVMAGAVLRDGAVLVARKDSGPEAGKWELPGGKLEDGETEQQALARELAEELGVKVRVGDRLGTDVALPDGMVLRTRRVDLVDGEPQPSEHSELRWIGAADLAGLDWLPADRHLVPALEAALGAIRG
jgi:8-oxo-dGTP diphosphatase